MATSTTYNIRIDKLMQRNFCAMPPKLTRRLRAERQRCMRRLVNYLSRGKMMMSEFKYKPVETSRFKIGWWCTAFLKMN